MPGSKKNKIKKQSLLDLPPPVLNLDDNNLVDDLLAQLDSRNQIEFNDLSFSDKAVTPVQKQDIKSRFKARQVLNLNVELSEVGF